jgi:preprotein translocase subunit SecD
MWVLIVFLIASLLFIFPLQSILNQSGVEVKYLEKNSSLLEKGLKTGMVITEINGQLITNLKDFEKAMAIFSDNQTHKLEIKTSSSSIIDFFPAKITDQIIVSDISKTNLKTGLDIQGGARALVVAQNHTLTDSELTDLISLSQQRFNVFGLSDLSLRKASDLSGNRYMVIEIAGSSPKDLEELIVQQGKFEGRIGNTTVFTGGKDVAHVERSGQQAGIEGCYDNQGGGKYCSFRFPISLTEEAAERQAAATKLLTISSENPQYLSQKLDLYVDDVLMDSLYISKDLQGRVTTQISIQGSGAGNTQAEAVKASEENMKKLQTILITGSLPYKLEIVKLDTISPVLGSDFKKAIFEAGFFAIIAVSFIIFLRYRKIGISLALLITSFSELVIILGFAALIKWNLDLPSIAGIIATIGTGVDSQIVILDESRFKIDSLKQRIQKALRIIFTSFGTAAVSLIPLTGFLEFMGIGAAGAGLLKGFAFTTLVGITAGVFITRPAFADIIKQMTKD